MSLPSDDSKQQNPPNEDTDSDAKAIFARRRRLVLAALSGLALSTTDCGSSTTPQSDAAIDAVNSEPVACLSIAPDTGLTDSGTETAPMPCLDIAIDSGTD